MLLPIDAITEVIPEKDYKLLVKFYDGSIKRVDMKPLIEGRKIFKPLKNPGLFKHATADGGGVVWNDEIDISQEYLYEHGETVG